MADGGGAQRRCALDAALGARDTSVRATQVSAEAAEFVACFAAEPSDVFVVTPPKTGTTLAQVACHALRGGTLDDIEHDVYEVSPWLKLAHDMGVDVARVPRPRVFK
eukprot:CAMPEP_0198356616 /NCGR_PEP_ID=MMETSP1450-20131203/123539_1 /TAXON_ID=753684 ORGANISM="Madagascaria erythrocladiodes, Strain CCMP3234" /NCGR_SAMPLE_ID=MMETSP1450 /ASSEMBLY_ACC=CAM_ASM_001115 /LENGTH=106 /DNA_ID=CAMNT_0044063131 /DNA_START=136 /DNA_END=453 /DNA_ORIENTATION=-